MSQQDPDVAKYQAALKRSSFRVPRGAIIAVLGVALIGGGWARGVARERARAGEADAKSREEAEAKSQREKELAEKEAGLPPQRRRAKANAALDPTAFPEGPIELARGRRVLGIHTSWQVLARASRPTRHARRRRAAQQALLPRAPPPERLHRFPRPQARRRGHWLRADQHHDRDDWHVPIPERAARSEPR